MHRENPITLNRFMAFFAGKQLLPLMNTKYRDHFIATLRSWLEFLETRYPNLKSNKLQRIFLDFVKWSNYHFPKWLEQQDFDNSPPRIMWYGPAKESEALFLYFLYLFGCDIVIFEPDGTDILVPYGITGFPTETLSVKHRNCLSSHSISRCVCKRLLRKQPNKYSSICMTIQRLIIRGNTRNMKRVRVF